MTELLLVLVGAFVVIAAAAVFGPRLGIASPLVLVAIGVAASFLPMFATVAIDPEWILEGVLPPLLYSAAVSMPTMNFRREFGAISGLSVLLVVISALLLGWFFTWAIPGLGFAWAVALGAVISPTDAVATSIIKKTSVSKRVVAMLDGESLLNDATALVLLGTATLAVTAGFSAGAAIGTFAYSVVVACLIGWGVASLNLVIRRRISDPTVNTVISFTVPFLASVPAGLLGASGLVAAVVAGLITGIFGPRYFSAQNRLSDSINWRTVELVLEGVVFLTMGIQIKAIVTSVQAEHAGVVTAVLIGAGALLITLLIRAAYIAPLLRVLTVWSRRGEQLRSRLADAQPKLGTAEGKREAYEALTARPGQTRPARKISERQVDRFATRITQLLADIDYFVRQPLGWREGAVVVWAGMRGAVTVAAAQTLPEQTPQRSVLILIAFVVATVSLLLQGGTIGPLLTRLTPPGDRAAEEQQDTAERERLFELLRSTSDTVPDPTHPDRELTPETFQEAKKYRLAVIAAAGRPARCARCRQLRCRCPGAHAAHPRRLPDRHRTAWQTRRLTPSFELDQSHGRAPVQRWCGVGHTRPRHADVAWGWTGAELYAEPSLAAANPCFVGVRSLGAAQCGLPAESS